MNFNAHATAHKWRNEDQVTNLPLILTGRAFAVYNQLTETEKSKSSLVLKALKDNFMPSETEYLQKFRLAKPGKNESTRDFALALADLYDKGHPNAKPVHRDRDLRMQLKSFLPDKYSTLILLSDDKIDWNTTVRIVASEIPILNECDSGEAPAQKSTLKMNFAGTESDKSSNSNNNKRKKNRNNQQSNDKQSNGQQSTSQQSNGTGYKFTKDQRRPGQCGRCGLMGHYAAKCQTALPNDKPAQV